MQSIEERLRTLEDREEIAKLKVKYIDASDGGWNRPTCNADQIADMFVEDGAWNAEGFSPAIGREAIRSSFRTFSANTPFGFHAISNQSIEVRGDTAIGDWHLTEFWTDLDDNVFWAGAIYSDHFIRTLAGWKFKSLSLTYAFSGLFKDGLANVVQRRKSGGAKA
jgi:hypothetical protein